MTTINMKKHKFLLSLILTLFMILPAALPVLAATNNTGNGLADLGKNFIIPNPTKYDNLEQVINALTSLIRPVFILTFTGMILYGAWVRLTSQGDPEKIKTSSQIIVAAIIGFAIAVFAPTIVDFAGKLLGLQTGLITATN